MQESERERRRTKKITHEDSRLEELSELEMQLPLRVLARPSDVDPVESIPQIDAQAVRAG